MKIEITLDQAAGLERAAQIHEAWELELYRQAGQPMTDEEMSQANFHMQAAADFRELLAELWRPKSSGEGEADFEAAGAGGIK